MKNKISSQRLPSYPTSDSQPISPPYRRHLSSDIIRILTAFFMLWVSIILTFGVICAYPNAQGVNEFYRFIFFLQNPLVVTINGLALLASLIHTLTWFNRIPKAINKGIALKKISSTLLIIVFWLIMIVCSVVVLCAISGYFR